VTGPKSLLLSAFFGKLLFRFALVGHLGRNPEAVMNHTALAHLAHRLRTADPALAATSDRQLLLRSVTGVDEDAFGELVRRHERTVLAACHQVLSDPADIEDAFQATFLALFQQAKHVKWDVSLGGWLFAVAHRVALRVVRNRQRKNRREAGARPRVSAVEPGADLSWREAVAALHEALDALPDRYRLPLILCYLEGLSRDEAAAQLGWRVNTVKSGLQRGRERLRADLARRGVTLGAGLFTALVVARTSASASPELLAATLRATTGRAPSPIRALANSSGLARAARAKFLLAPVVAAALGAGILAAGLTAPRAATESSEPPAAPQPRSGERAAPVTPKEIHGRILGPDGKSVAGAKVYAVRSSKSGPGEWAVVATSASDGTFRTAHPAQGEWRVPVLIAHKDGFGVAWEELGGTESVALKLVADHAITGRVIDTEGKSVAGARVFASRIAAPKDDNLDQLLDTWKVDRTAQVARRTLNDSWGGGRSTVTGADGTFTLTGCGADRIVEVAVRGEGLARKSITVVNRAKFDPGPINAAAETWRKDNPQRPLLVVSGPDVKLVAERGKTIEGVVLDATTKKPLVGASVSDFTAHTKTDEKGRFQFRGLKKAKQYTIWVGGPVGGDYLGQNVRIDDTEGYAPATCEIELRQGAVVSGRVTDKSTGKPVRGTVVIVPIEGNKFFAEYFPGNQRADRGGHLVDADGRFRIVTVPGKVLVTVQCHETVRVGDENLMVFRGSGPDPDHPDVFDTKRQAGFAFLTLADRSLHAVSNADHGARVIDAPGAGKSVEVNFALERGALQRIRIEDPAGKPVAGATVIGLAHTNVPATLPESTATVYALDPKAAPRRVIVWHAEKKLGATALVRGDEREPVRVALAPLADITGKFVTADGEPIAGASVLIEPAEELDGLAAFLSVRFGFGSRARVKTAADGTFTLAGVLPGVEYRVRFMKGMTFFPADRDTKPPSAKPEAGKVIDLGTLRAPASEPGNNSP
jgi:RNA polymerase sigma factor (sigma-70 family)